jgi:hypothetical protein
MRPNSVRPAEHGEPSRAPSAPPGADAPPDPDLEHGLYADDAAVDAARARRARRDAQRASLLSCHACDAPIEGEVAGRGLMVFPRGDGVLREEPPLCERCALAVGITALWRFAEEEEEG